MASSGGGAGRRSRPGGWWAVLVAVVLVLGVGVAPAPGARSAFPGLNGTIAFYTGNGYNDLNSNIWTIAAAGDTPASVAPGWDPAWSPNGAYLAFTYGDPYYSQPIVVADADGSGTRLLRNATGWSPTWSPDGSKIAYITGGRALWVVGADGSNPHYVAGCCWFGVDNPSWSPDGSKIAVEYTGFQGHGSGIAVVEPDGSNYAELVPTDNNLEYSFAPDWSPDGSRVAFARKVLGSGSSGPPPTQIAVVDADGSNLALLTECANCGENGDFSPAWSPDGSQIAFERSRWGQQVTGELMVMDADGQNLGPLTSTSSYPNLPRAPAWRPVPEPNTLARIQVAVSTPVAAGSPVTVTATALDSSGQLMTSYNASATWSDTESDLSPLTPASFVNGTSITTATLPPTPRHGTVIRVTSGGVTGLSEPIDVRGPLAAISVSGPRWETATIPFSVRATATDSAGNTLTDYNGTASWSSLDGALSPSAPNDFVNGVSTTQATIGVGYSADRITVTSGGVSGQSDPFNVDAPVRIDLSFSTPMSVGVPFTVRAVARDAAGNKMTGYDGMAVWSDLSGSLSPGVPARFVNGVSTTTATISSAFHNDRLTVTSAGVSALSGPFHVYGPLAALGLSMAPVSARAPLYLAGGSFTVRASAFDAAHNLLTGYHGAVAWSDLSGSLAPAAPNAFVNGVSTTTATISAPFHSDRLTLTSAGVSSQTGPFHVYGPLASIGVSLPPSTARTYVYWAGGSFTVRASAYDAAHNLLVGYQGAVSWSSKGGTLTPTSPGPFVDGVSTTQAVIPVASRDDRITVSSGGISGHSGRIAIVGPVAKIDVRVKTPVVHGHPFTVTATALDSLGSTVITTTGPATWSSRDGGLTPTTPSNFVHGVSTTTATIPTAFHDDRITVQIAGLTGKSNYFAVN